jgi:hypothetical protein
MSVKLKEWDDNLSHCNLIFYLSHTGFSKRTGFSRTSCSCPEIFFAFPPERVGGRLGRRGRWRANHCPRAAARDLPGNPRTVTAVAASDPLILRLVTSAVSCPRDGDGLQCRPIDPRLMGEQLRCINRGRTLVKLRQKSPKNYRSNVNKFWTV